MKTAELLYNKGFISYPRTETNSFKPFTNFKKLIEFQRDHETLSKYANSLLSNRIYPPREGPKNDNSHPPIYPAKALNRNALDLDNVNLITPEEIELYELIARCFLACCSKDASANEKIFDLELEKEAFYFKELKIKELNFLEIYPYEKWLETQILSEKFEVGQILENVTILTLNKVQTESGRFPDPASPTRFDICHNLRSKIDYHWCPKLCHQSDSFCTQ